MPIGIAEFRLNVSHSIKVAPNIGDTFHGTERNLSLENGDAVVEPGSELSGK